MDHLNMTPPLPDLRVTIGPLSLANPVMTASGTFGYAQEFETLMNLRRLGAIIVKGISLHPRAGNPPPCRMSACSDLSRRSCRISAVLGYRSSSISSVTA